MEVVFIDPEPPDATGGGIRTYLRLVLESCRRAGFRTQVYTHNPLAYPGESPLPIGRKPWLPFPWRALAYRWCYQENVLWEHSRWLQGELEARDAPGRIYEFCDYMGYAAFALRRPALRRKCIVRVHTPHYLTVPPGAGMRGRLSFWLGRFRERYCLRKALRVTAPSAEFMREKLAWLEGWTHLPNPLPMVSASEGHATGPAPAGRPGAQGGAAAFLYLGRIERRKGALVLLRAFARLAAEYPGATLTLVGGVSPGCYGEAVRACLEFLPAPVRDRIRLEPPRPPQARDALFSRFTALAVPSLWENSPYVYFEGMAAGLLCLGSATGEMKAVAGVTGGPLARPGDEEDWLRALRAVCAGAVGGSALLAAQADYLRERREAILQRTMEYYRAAGEGP